MSKPMSPRIFELRGMPRPDFDNIDAGISYPTMYPPPVARPGLKSTIDHNREKFTRRHADNA